MKKFIIRDKFINEARRAAFADMKKAKIPVYYIKMQGIILRTIKIIEIIPINI